MFLPPRVSRGYNEIDQINRSSLARMPMKHVIRNDGVERTTTRHVALPVVLEIFSAASRRVEAFHIVVTKSTAVCRQRRAFHFVDRQLAVLVIILEFDRNGDRAVKMFRGWNAAEFDIAQTYRMVH